MTNKRIMPRKTDEQKELDYVERGNLLKQIVRIIIKRDNTKERQRDQ